MATIETIYLGDLRTEATHVASGNKIITDAYKRTEQILTEHVDKLHLLAETLVKLEKVNEEQFVSLMENGTLPEKEVKEPETIEEITETVEEVTETKEANE